MSINPISLRNIVRRALHRPEVYPCGCPIATVEILLGQHPWSCKHHNDPHGFDARRFKLGEAPEHRVDGVLMPWVGPGSREMSNRWCDTSTRGDGTVVSRRFDVTGHFATASRYPAELAGLGWHWSIFDFNGDPDQEPEIVVSSNAFDLADVFEAVSSLEMRFELASTA